MPYAIETSLYSFVQFAESDTLIACNWAPISTCLPVTNDDDVWFQFVIKADTEEEADAICNQDNEAVRVGIGQKCIDTPTFFTQKPIRNRISPVRILYYWPYGVPDLNGLVELAQCFRFIVEVSITDTSFCSNCFQRTLEDCHSSVVEYTNNTNAYGFNYCASANESQQETDECDPTILAFNNNSVLTIPYTAFLANKYGNTPTVEAWIYNELGELVRAGIVIQFDAYPPTQIEFDFGGNASGIIKIM